MDYLRKNAAIIISVIALLATFWQISLQNENNRISVRPVLSAYFSLDGRESNRKDGLYFYNGGLGNGIVHNIIVTVDGKETQNNKLGKFYSALYLMGYNPTCYFYSIPRANDILVKDEEIALIEAVTPQPAKCAADHALFTLTELLGNTHRFDFKIQYESLYGEKFTYLFRENRRIDGWTLGSGMSD